MRFPTYWKTLAVLIPTFLFGMASVGCQNTLHSRFSYDQNKTPRGVQPPAYQGPVAANYHGVQPGKPKAVIADSKIVQAQYHSTPANKLPPTMEGSTRQYIAAPEARVGPQVGLPVGQPLPTELAPVSHPPYTVAPPDVLFIEAQNLLPRPPYRLQPLDVLNVTVPEGSTLPNQPIAGKYTITPDGTINLGYSYGTVRVAGMSATQAGAMIRRHLSNVIQNAEVVVGLESFRAVQQVRGEHLVRPDGTISLGAYGGVYVAGLTLGQIQTVIQQHLSQYTLNPRVSVDVFAYNSKKYYVIADGGGFGQLVFAFPYTGYETVLDAVSKINGLPAVASKKYIWVARPGPAHLGCSQVLPVDWRAITENGQTRTNWQLMPGDRVYVQADCLIRADNFLAKLLSPIERILGITLLGSSTVNSFSNNNGIGTGIIAPF